MEKNEYLYWVEWIKVRWPNTKLLEQSIKNLYDDFKIYSDEVFGKCMIEYFDQGNEFINWSAIKKRCKELQIEEYSNKAQQIALESKNKDLEEDKPTGLMSYIKSQGWNSLEEAVFYTSKRLYRMNQLYKPSKEAFAKYHDMEYKEAKDQGFRLGLSSGLE